MLRSLRASQRNRFSKQSPDYRWSKAANSLVEMERNTPGKRLQRHGLPVADQPPAIGARGQDRFVPKGGIRRRLASAPRKFYAFRLPKLGCRSMLVM